MHRPVIEIDGEVHDVHSVSWFEDERISSVSFYVGRKHYTAFNKTPWDEEGLREDGVAYFDLSKCLKWSEPDA